MYLFFVTVPTASEILQEREVEGIIIIYLAEVFLYLTFPSKEIGHDD